MIVIIMGSGSTGALLAERLHQGGHHVRVIESNPRNVANLPRKLVDTGEIVVVRGDGSTVDAMNEAGIGEADIFVATTGSDTLNGLAAQKARLMFRVTRVIATVRDPDLRRLYDSLGVVTVNPAQLAANQVLGGIEPA